MQEPLGWRESKFEVGNHAVSHWSPGCDLWSNVCNLLAVYENREIITAQGMRTAYDLSYRRDVWGEFCKTWTFPGTCISKTTEPAAMSYNGYACMSLRGLVSNAARPAGIVLARGWRDPSPQPRRKSGLRQDPYLLGDIWPLIRHSQRYFGLSSMMSTFAVSE